MTMSITFTDERQAFIDAVRDLAVKERKQFGRAIGSFQAIAHRTTLAGAIYGGTSEIQRDIIAKTFGL